MNGNLEFDGGGYSPSISHEDIGRVRLMKYSDVRVTCQNGLRVVGIGSWKDLIKFLIQVLDSS